MKFRHIVVIALAFGVIVFFFRPKLGRAPTSSDEIPCANNLKSLYVFAVTYADKRDRYFPHTPGGSIASFQQLVDAFPDDVRPEDFVCPSGKESPASRVDGRLSLTTESCSYEAVPWKLTLWEDAILYFDKKPYHGRGRGRRVVLASGTVLFVDEDTFQKRIEDERERFSAPATEITPKPQK